MEGGGKLISINLTYEKKIVLLPLDGDSIVYIYLYIIHTIFNFHCYDNPLEINTTCKTN